MCRLCGCSNEAHSHAHPHSHDHDHDHDHSHASEHRRIEVEQEILLRNDRLAERNRGWLAGRGVLAINLVSAPGAGKTTLLERILRDGRALHVLEGDQATELDAERVRAAGARALQINTGAGCHLDAAMIARALPELDPPPGSLLVIENVGNLVCPALFDLGEHAKVLVAGVTEGDDKPEKYPHMFRASRLVLLGKIDLLPHLSFDVGRFIARARAVNPALEVIPVSAKSGEGMGDFYGWLDAQRAS
jgi:hydrogenase nickel incorporation protein HypB